MSNEHVIDVAHTPFIIHFITFLCDYFTELTTPKSNARRS